MKEAARRAAPRPDTDAGEAASVSDAAAAAAAVPMKLRRVAASAGVGAVDGATGDRIVGRCGHMINFRWRKRAAAPEKSLGRGSFSAEGLVA